MALQTNKELPIRLGYGHADSLGKLRGEARATADALGGWIQVIIAGGFCLFGILAGILITGGIPSYPSLWLGMGGLIVGLFIPVPADAGEWRRLATAMVGGGVGIIVGLWIFPSEFGSLLGICGYRLGLALHDLKS